PALCGVAVSATVDNAGSTAGVWSSTPKTTSCNTPGLSPPLLNGRDTYDYGTVATWNQLQCTGDNCTGDHAPIGTYEAVVHPTSSTARSQLASMLATQQRSVRA